MHSRGLVVKNLDGDWTGLENVFKVMSTINNTDEFNCTLYTKNETEEWGSLDDYINYTK